MLLMPVLLALLSRGENVPCGFEQQTNSLSPRVRISHEWGCRSRHEAPDLLGDLGSLSSLPDLIRQSMLPPGAKSHWVYSVASRPRGMLYVGIER